jgi:hypothetical protein
MIGGASMVAYADSCNRVSTAAANRKYMGITCLRSVQNKLGQIGNKPIRLRRSGNDVSRCKFLVRYGALLPGFLGN